MNIKSGLCIVFVFFFLSGCDKSPDSIIDSSSKRPNLLAVVLTTPVFNTDTIFVNGQKSSSDQLTLSVGFNATIGIPMTAVQSFHFAVTKTSNSAEIASGDIPLTETERREIQGNYKLFVFQKIFLLPIQRSDIGIFNVDISAIDGSGLESNTYRSPLSILRLNKPPQISNLQSPDTLQLPAEGYVVNLLTLKVDDPNGIADIQKVQFTSILPDGKPSSSGPIQMYDDGGKVDLGGYNSGDTNAADGIYSRIIQLRSDATRGTYTFSFVAIDKSNDTSNVITHTIIVQ